MNPTQSKMNQSQKLMVFVLTMSLYGLATLFTDHVFSSFYSCTRGRRDGGPPVYCSFSCLS